MAGRFSSVISRKANQGIGGRRGCRAVLTDLGRPTKAQVLNAMKGHVLGEAQLIGTYKKKG
jgi:hypothetical protein